MVGNTLTRRVVKRLLAPVLTEGTYSVLQAVAMGWDIRRGAWHEPEIDLLDYALKKGETAIDIGANYGLYAYHLSRCVGPSGKVVCFEPIPFTARTFRLVQRGLGFGKNVELVNKGASDKTGKTQFTVPVMGSGEISAGLVHMGRNDERPGKEKRANFATKQVECEVVAIDEYLPACASARDVALVKCDIEGADLFAMRGMRKILDANKPTVIMEISPWYLEGFRLTVADITSFFGELGYDCYRYADRRLTRVATSEIDEDNWVFIHPDRRSRFKALLNEA